MGRSLRCVFVYLCVMMFGGMDALCIPRALADPAKGEILEVLKDTQKRLEHLERDLKEVRRDLHTLNGPHLGINRYRFPKEIEIFGRRVPLERRDVWERLDREFLLTVDDVPQVLLWLKRANRYFPYIEEELRKRGLPQDLKYVAIVESALKARAYSRRGAAGYWQFIASTGRRYSLRRDHWVDERLDLVRSTRAALDYLSDLYEMFGDWLLAVAAYNLGEKKLERALKEQGVKDYYDLYLPVETERYIFRLISAKIIFMDPEGYGFSLEEEELYEPLECDRLHVRVTPRRLPLKELAFACGVTYRTIKKLNPHFKREVIPPGSYWINVPKGKAKAAREFVSLWNRRGYTPMKKGSSIRRIVHKVRKGESLWIIARRYGVSTDSLRRWNKLDHRGRIYPGQRLLIYK